jgi:acyl-coenzyme A synthetase/AMP-(fatty) acid ligase
MTGPYTPQVTAVVVLDATAEEAEALFARDPESYQRFAPDRRTSVAAILDDASLDDPAAAIEPAKLQPEGGPSAPFTIMFTSGTSGKVRACS